MAELTFRFHFTINYTENLSRIFTRDALRAAPVKKRVGHLFRRRRVFIFLRRRLNYA